MPKPDHQLRKSWKSLTVDLVSRVPTHRKLLGGVRITATFAIAAFAAFISYGHMAAVTSRYGETGIVPYLLPLSVDSMTIVASVSLVELAGRLRETTPTPLPAVTRLPSPPVRGTSGADPVEASRIQASLTRDDGHSSSAGTSSAGSVPEDQEEAEAGEARPDVQGRFVIPPDLSPDLVPLLAAARKARDELQNEGTTISRDALATRLRRNGHSLRTSRITELFAAIKAEGTPTNGRRPRNPR